MVFQCINIRQVPWEVLKTAAFGLGFQHLPRDLANVNAWKNMFDPYITMYLMQSIDLHQSPRSAASDLGLHCLPMYFYGMLGINGLKPAMKQFICVRRFDKWVTNVTNS